MQFTASLLRGVARKTHISAISAAGAAAENRNEVIEVKSRARTARECWKIISFCAALAICCLLLPLSVMFACNKHQHTRIYSQFKFDYFLKSLSRTTSSCWWFYLIFRILVVIYCAITLYVGSCMKSWICGILSVVSMLVAKHFAQALRPLKM